MKRHLLTTAVATALAFGASTAQALPTLQLTIIGGSYASADETTYASEPVFTLVALLDPEGKNQGGPNSDPASLDDTFYISAAVVPKIDEGDTLGSFTFDSSRIDVTDDMEFGTPPLEALIGGDDYGNLPGHSIFQTYFTQFSFMFNAADRVEAFDAQNRTPSSLGDVACDTGDRCIYFATFDLDLTALSELYGIHFDLYSQDERVCKNDNVEPKCEETVASIGDFAPFSHDAQGSSTSTGFPGSNGTAPEPGTLTLFGIGILGGLFAHRRRRQMHA